VPAHAVGYNNFLFIVAAVVLVQCTWPCNRPRLISPLAPRRCRPYVIAISGDYRDRPACIGRGRRWAAAASAVTWRPYGRRRHRRPWRPTTDGNWRLLGDVNLAPCVRLRRSELSLIDRHSMQWTRQLQYLLFNYRIVGNNGFFLIKKVCSPASTNTRSKKGW